MTNAKNIYLVGPMGVGKTTIGKALAKNLTLDFVDSDFEIEQRTGVTISTIFDIEGEDGFRNREIRMVTELAERKGIVLATGGGAVLSEDVRKALRHNGLVVYLHASIDMQMDRTDTIYQCSARARQTILHLECIRILPPRLCQQITVLNQA